MQNLRSERIVLRYSRTIMIRDGVLERRENTSSHDITELKFSRQFSDPADFISIQTHSAFCLLTACYLHLRDCTRGRQVERLYCVWLYRVWLSCFRRRSGRELDIQRCGHEDDTRCNDQHSQQYPAASGSSCFIELLVETCGQTFICVNWLPKSCGFDNLPTFLNIPVVAQIPNGFLPNHVPHPNPVFIRS